ncbi:MAG: hypothetical protein ABIE22_03465 [archaeon]
MIIDIADLRIRINQINERIISGLKDRSRYKLNKDIFSEEFSSGMTWFEYRLKKEQDLDSEFGRFEFPDQSPIVFKKEELTSPRKQRIIPETEVKMLSFDIGKEIIEFYKEILPELCSEGEESESYGEIAKLDVSNILLFSERISGIGKCVAQAKLQKNPGLKDLQDEEQIKGILADLSREREVIDEAKRIAEKYELKNPGLVEKIFKKIIELNTKMQVEYVRSFLNS